MEPIEATRNMLGIWGKAQMQIAELQDELRYAQERINDTRDTIRSQQITGMPRSGAKTDLSDAVIKLQEIDEAYQHLLNHIAKELDDLIRLKTTMDEVIRALPYRHQEILRLRYKQGMAYEQIAMVLHYSVDHIKRLKSEAEHMISRQISMR